jgi:hypothetical protein
VLFNAIFESCLRAAESFGEGENYPKLLFIPEPGSRIFEVCNG